MAEPSFPWNECFEVTTSPEARAVVMGLSAIFDSIEALRRDLRPLRPEPLEENLRFICEVHGLLHVAIVRCEHDAERHTQEVYSAHRSSSGANCHAVITVEQHLASVVE